MAFIIVTLLLRCTSKHIIHLLPSRSLFLLISLGERFCCIFVCNNCWIQGYVAAKRKRQMSKVHLIMYTAHDLWIHVSFFLLPHTFVCSKTFPYFLTYCYTFSNIFPLTFTIFIFPLLTTLISLIIYLFIFLYFWLFLFSFSYYEFPILSHILCIVFTYTKDYFPLSLFLSFFFFFFFSFFGGFFFIFHASLLYVDEFLCFFITLV